MKVTIDGARAGPAAGADLQGDDAERLPQLRLHARLHQRLLDAEGRPHLRIHLPPAQPHGRDGYRIATPTVTDPSVTEEPLLDFNSGYVLRALDHLPKQGSKEPWKLRQNYPVDLRMLRHGAIDDGTMRFSNPAPRRQPRDPGPRLGLLIEVVDLRPRRGSSRRTCGTPS